MVVAVIGSTEESAVDDISKILELKPIYEAKVIFSRCLNLLMNIQHNIQHNIFTLFHIVFLREKKKQL